MEKRYSIETKGGIIAVRFIQEAKATDICDALDDVAEISPGNLRLWDFTNGADLTHLDILKVT